MVGHLCFNNEFIGKEIRFVVTRGRGGGQGELDEVSPKLETSSYKINIRNVTYNKINIINIAVVYIQKLKLFFYFFNFVPI